MHSAPSRGQRGSPDGSADASAHPLWVVLFAAEVLGVVTGAVVAVVIARRPLPAIASSVPDCHAAAAVDGNDPDRYPTAIAGLLGIADEPDLRASVRDAWRPAFAARHADRRSGAWRWCASTGRAVSSLIVGLALSLLLGVAPLDRPSPWLLGVGVRRSRAHVGRLDAADRRCDPTR